MQMRVVPRWFLGVMLAGLIAGCVTNRLDWNARIGNYTFDQAITELGPPDKQVKMSDGKSVAEWITRYYGGGSTIISPVYYGRPGVGYVQTFGPTMYESSLLLTFTTNNVLAQWSRH